MTCEKCGVVVEGDAGAFFFVEEGGQEKSVFCCDNCDPRPKPGLLTRFFRWLFGRATN